MNPFLTKGYKGPTYFCDRDSETEKLIEAINNSRNITLFSERRMGKTTLLKHVNYRLKNEIVYLFLDLYPTQNLKSLIQLLSLKILESLEPFSETVIRKITSFFSAFKPKFSFDAQTGAPSIELSLDDNREIEKSFSLLFEYIRKSGKKVVVVFDEFQQVLKYPEKNVEALLRSEIQNDAETTFIFSGSLTHLLHAMFTEYNRPFYQSTQFLQLDKIQKEKYANFIVSKFQLQGSRIDTKLAEFIIEINNGITYNVQFLCNKLYSQNEPVLTQKLVSNVFEEIIQENEAIYFSYRELLSSLQYKLLVAIAKEGTVEKPYSTQFITKYKLGSTSSVRTASKNLLDKGILMKNKGIYVSDWYFKHWLAKQL